METQGRGTIHLHMLVWVKGAPTSNEMLDLLKSEEFRKKLTDFIAANIRSYLPGLEDAQSVKKIPVDNEVAYNRPVKPMEENHEQKRSAFELKLARSLQIHSCRARRCLVPDKKGQLWCKRGTPFKCHNEDFVDKKGEWGSKMVSCYPQQRAM